MRLASHYGFTPDFCHANDPQSKGIVEHLCGYAQRDLAVPLLTVLCLIVARLTGWTMEYVLLESGLLFLPFVPALFRYSRVVWMHFDRVVDPDLGSEHFVTRV